MATRTEYDYIIAGGGLCGCVVASRLIQAFSDRSVALVETGPDSRGNPTVLSPATAWALPADYYQNYLTQPQKPLNNRSLDLKTGRVLGGGSAVNYGGWTRGDRSGYDEWAKLVGDDRGTSTSCAVWRS
ncbi:GMC-type oxidoreductase acuG [Fulvia fulva]|uniref:GMC-type oxidoreductase acuG n=1 Tax=Passalora fulva TaxID=5499 RepID=A0A9Q8UTN6_PASFU|nr:GMC-type oxidoreductase acuG [Fulvia fulva]KAK4613781.1 GMC-type oxidoreductase acuG [Fulvia fulva]KAK4614984.1 GMC-type oxidoreductase acuG [Fulvia fulva]UJO22000.1 GMC-type oxidoreductase acuG [Fulvia fulva]WPV20708.1 GMC-type oxidoreductase acuG [Fulvia fulva]WPV35504.1 GMC-type oxidoreductase acuG [Fulvia fulva]